MMTFPMYGKNNKMFQSTNQFNIAIENGPCLVDLLMQGYERSIKMVIFRCYVSLPEGTCSLIFHILPLDAAGS